MARTQTMPKDNKYHLELEQELERITKELAQVRVEKERQRQRISQLQEEQHELKNQLNSGGDKDRLSRAVRAKKAERSKVQEEWAKNHVHYQQLKQTMGLLTGKQEDVTDMEDDLDGMPEDSRDFLQSLWGSMKHNTESMRGAFDNNAGFGDLEEASFDASFDEDADQVGAIIGGASIDASFDNDTVITEQTKDSLQVHKARRANRSSRKPVQNFSVDDDNDTVITELTKDSVQLAKTRKKKTSAYPDDDNDTVITEQTKDSIQLHRDRKTPNKKGQRKPTKLANFLDNGGKGSSKANPTSNSNNNKSNLGDFFEKTGRYKTESLNDEKECRSASE